MSVEKLTDGAGTTLTVYSLEGGQIVLAADFSRDAGRRVALFVSPDDARNFACKIVRIADQLDPPGSFVKRGIASAWRPIDTAPVGMFVLLCWHDGFVASGRKIHPSAPWETIHGALLPSDPTGWLEIPL